MSGLDHEAMYRHLGHPRLEHKAVASGADAVLEAYQLAKHAPAEDREAFEAIYRERLDRLQAALNAASALPFKYERTADQ